MKVSCEKFFEFEMDNVVILLELRIILFMYEFEREVGKCFIWFFLVFNRINEFGNFILLRDKILLWDSNKDLRFDMVENILFWKVVKRLCFKFSMVSFLRFLNVWFFRSLKLFCERFKIFRFFNFLKNFDCILIKLFIFRFSFFSDWSWENSVMDEFFSMLLEMFSFLREDSLLKVVGLILWIMFMEKFSVVKFCVFFRKFGVCSFFIKFWDIFRVCKGDGWLMLLIKFLMLLWDRFNSKRWM